MDARVALFFPWDPELLVALKFDFLICREMRNI